MKNAGAGVTSPKRHPRKAGRENCVAASIVGTAASAEGTERSGTRSAQFARTGNENSAGAEAMTQGGTRCVPTMPRMLPSPGSLPVDAPVEGPPTALASPRAVVNQPLSAWQVLPLLVLVGLALVGLILGAVHLARHWSMDQDTALVLALGSALLCGVLVQSLMRGTGHAATDRASQPAPVMPTPDLLDATPTPAVLLHKQGDHWTVVRMNAAAQQAGLPPAEGPAIDWLARVEPAMAQAQQAAQAESESFAYTVSHDLRAPIRVIEGFTRIVREDYGQALDRIGNDHLDRVLGAAARMNSMIDALLALARLSSQPLTRQRVDLSRMAQYVLDDLLKHTPQRQVETRVMPGLEVDGDPTLMRLVLENLLGNAWKYSSRRDVAHIEFGAEYRPKAAASQRPPPEGNALPWDGPAATPLVQESQRVFYVSDDGAGFDMRFAERLFGAFQRLHSASEFQGTGVGLASVRRIVRRHGGEIWAEAEVDRGATFYFTLG